MSSSTIVCPIQLTAAVPMIQPIPPTDHGIKSKILYASQINTEQQKAPTKAEATATANGILAVYFSYPRLFQRPPTKNRRRQRRRRSWVAKMEGGVEGGAGYEGGGEWVARWDGAR